MFSKFKRTTLLVTLSTLLVTIDPPVVLADSTDSTTTSTTSVSDTNNSDTSKTNVPNTNSSSVMTTDANSYNNIDVAAVKSAMYSELNRLRAQNGLTALTSTDVLNNYAQERTDSFINNGGVDNHARWNSSEMAPYNYTAEENIAQMPFSMIGTTDALVIAEKITDEFYSENYDSVPDFGHRKNMLNPYINYVGIGVSISGNGMVYFSQEMGNDLTAYNKYDFRDINDYYLTKYNDYANPSKYDIADINRKNADYKQRSNYTTADLRGGVSTKNYVTPLYDRYGNERSDLTLSPNSDWISDMIATINGKKYYHVSTNGFASSQDILPWARFLYGGSITTTTVAKVYDNNGFDTGQTVSAGSRWVLDRRAVNPLTGIKMYRIGTNAWIQQDQLHLN